MRNMDVWGSTTSILCAIHCALLPLLLSSGFIGAHTLMSHPAVEFCIMGLTSVFVYYSIVRPYFQNKLNSIPFTLATTGLVFVLIHHFIPHYSTFIVVIGGLLIAAGHLVNLFGAKHSHNS